tara:strand:+ start:95 stop:715 length:621 start_codon:yes stop_codon:yes gene_type:complete
MLIHSIFFYFFSVIAVFSAVMVVVSRNAVHSVFFLILDFISISCLFIMIGAEFLGMIMLIVYVGAVAVLFLFVVMMLNVSLDEVKKGFSTHLPIGLLVSLIVFLEILVVIGGWKYKSDLVTTSSIVSNQKITNTEAIGNLLYTDYIYLFQISGMILLVAMVGAIVLTFRKRKGIKRQNVFDQISKERADSVFLADVETGKGVKIDD